MTIEWGSVAEWSSGAISGLAVITALYFSNSAVKEAERRDIRADRAIAHKTTSKLGLVLNAISDLKRHFEPAFAKAPTDNPFGAKWPYIQGLTGIMATDSIRLDADEIDFLFRLGDMQLAQELPLAMRRHEATVAGAHTYRELRDGMISKMPKPVAAEGMLGTVEHSLEEIVALAPMSATTEGALNSLVDRLVSDWDFTMKIAGEFGGAVRAYLHDNTFQIFSPKGLINRDADTGGE